MRDKIFIDTNIFVYSALEDEEERIKHEKAIDFLEKMEEADVVVSTQVLNEFYSTLIKHNIPEEDIQERINVIIENSVISLITVNTIKSSWDIRKRYKFSLWDSLIIASAIENECSRLYSEDMQHNQLLDNKLRITNPFFSI